MTGRWWLLPAALAVGPPAALALVRAALPEPARLLFEARLLYWTMPVVLALAAAAFWWRWRRGGATVRAAAARWWPGGALALVLTGVVLWLVRPEMRVQFDETSLVGVSRNMHDQRAALLTTGAIPFEGAVLPLENMVDKRPPLFAFLVSLLHDVAGPRIENAFAVNAVLLAAALLLAFAAARTRLDLRGALAAPLLLLAVPLTAVVATSAGFELLSAVLFGGVLLAALDFARRPDTVRCVTFLASGVLFAQSRYESLLALLVVGAAVLWSVRGRWVPDRRAVAALAACPGLLTPLVFLLLLARDPDFYPEAGGQALVSLQHGRDHVAPFVAEWFRPALANPLPGVLAIAGAAAWAWWLGKRRGSCADAIVAGPVFAVTAIVLLWFYGDVREPTALRLFLPLAWLSALAPLLFVALAGRRLSPWLLGAAAILCALRLHDVQRGAAFPRLAIAQLTDAIDAVLRRPGVDRGTTLWVGTPAQHIVVKGGAALSPKSFAARPRDVQELLRRGHLRTILVVVTPLDALLAPAFGDPQTLLRTHRSVVEAQVDGAMPITVHRLLP